MTRRIVIVCGFSGNTEIIVPQEIVFDSLPEGIAHNKNAGCMITPSPEGGKTSFTVVLPRGDRISIGPSVPYTRFAGSSVNICQMARALDAKVHAWLTISQPLKKQNRSDF